MRKYLLLFLFSLLCLVGVSAWQIYISSDQKLHIIFCNVGQGDAIFIKTPSRKHILVDGGPDKSILDCLSRHLPFWERQIDIVILSHPHADHHAGLVPVLQRYEVKEFVQESLKNDTDGFVSLERAVKEEKSRTRFIYRGDRYQIVDGVTLHFLNPTRELLEELSPGGYIAKTGEQVSVETLVTFKSFTALLTADIQALELEEGIRSLGHIDVLQVPHHGSRTGLSEMIVDQLSPKVAVISVGKNTYGHPAASILQLLEKNTIKSFRTDKTGDIEVISDGKSWTIAQ